MRRVRVRIAVAFLAHVSRAIRPEPAQRPSRDALIVAGFKHNPARNCAFRQRFPPLAEQCRRLIDGLKRSSKINWNVVENIL
ncbi:hypothetical protein BCEP4_250020 [Burkholderia cepacia]|nr:hypothetical protein BCEP4_250020 [Burkholderia cepacia]